MCSKYLVVPAISSEKHIQMQDHDLLIPFSTGLKTGNIVILLKAKRYDYVLLSAIRGVCELAQQFVKKANVPPKNERLIVGSDCG